MLSLTGHRLESCRYGPPLNVRCKVIAGLIGHPGTDFDLTKRKKVRLQFCSPGFGRNNRCVVHVVSAGNCTFKKLKGSHDFLEIT
jgi:hypothetical protein